MKKLGTTNTCSEGNILLPESGELGPCIRLQIRSKCSERNISLPESGELGRVADYIGNRINQKITNTNP